MNAAVPSSRWSMGALLVVAALLCGCRAMDKVAQAPANAVRVLIPIGSTVKEVDLVELQQTLMRFADDYSQRMGVAFEEFRRGDEPLSRREVLTLRTAYNRQVQQIASGPNAFANLLDMTTLVVLTRRVIEETDLSEFGDSTAQIRQVCVGTEREILNIARGILSANQLDELLGTIRRHDIHLESPRSVAFVRAINFLPKSDAPKTTGDKPKESVFDLLKLDPLAGLNPATREIAETRLFAERAMYVAQRMPEAARLEAELLSLSLIETRDVQSAIQSAAAASSAADRLSRTAEALPAQFAAERKAILDAVNEQSAPLSALARQTEDALDAGSTMSSNLTVTLRAFDDLMKTLGVDKPRDPSAPPGEPFRITDYTAAAAQIDAGAKQLSELLRTVDATLGSTNLTAIETRAAALVDNSDAKLRDLLDWIFWRALLLVAAVFAGLAALHLLKRRPPPQP